MTRKLMSLSSLNLTLIDGIAVVFLIALPFVLPLFSIPEVGSLVSAASAVFAIVAGFFIADATGNYLRLQTLLSEENASLITLMHHVHSGAPEFVEEARASIDAYLIGQLDADELDHVVFTKQEFENLMEVIDRISAAEGVKNAESARPFEEEQSKLVALSQEITLAARSNLTAVHWCILVVLAGVVGATVLAIRDGSILMHLISASMLVGCLGVLVVLRDVDNNRYLQRKLSFRNPQQVFQALALPPYYPPIARVDQRVPDAAGVYRTRNAQGTLIEVR